ncbi:DUF4199 domain-containing protein [Flavobacterium terrigena]|uniref:DUF4199 domain-containing protein n=1 Tax=Flavobacterium terrigena TaxID=402734 RepID=A0A1H6XZ46_9FLAO|nr:DUF4199 domain-containing protein [Flavobacterium terrigena]SEJ30120.1 Protein of unknown function [Flavobacterium terrigena]
MNEAIKKNGIKFGLISAVISIVVTVLMYAIDINLFANSYIGIGMVVFYISLGIYVVSTTKKEMGGIINFKEAFTAFFIYCTIGIVIANIFNYILFNFIDPAAKEQILELAITKTVEFMEKFDTPKEAMKEAITAMKENGDQYSLANIIKGSAFSIIFSSIVGLIVAAVMKTKTTYNE